MTDFRGLDIVSFGGSDAVRRRLDGCSITAACATKVENTSGAANTETPNGRILNQSITQTLRGTSKKWTADQQWTTAFYIFFYWIFMYFWWEKQLSPHGQGWEYPSIRPCAMRRRDKIVCCSIHSTRHPVDKKSEGKGKKSLNTLRGKAKEARLFTLF